MRQPHKPRRCSCWRKNLTAVLVTASVVARAASAVAGNPIVAVFNIEQRGVPLGPQAMANLSDYLADTLAATGSFEVVPRDQLRARLAEQKKSSYKSCVDQSCQIELGRELAAQKSLATKILKIGSKCAVTATLFDLKKSTTERGATAEGGCTEDGVVASLKTVVDKLVGRAVTVEPPAPSAPAAPVTAELQVLSEPANAMAVVTGATDREPFGGVYRGTTPLNLSALKPGVYQVQLSRDGYLATSQWITVRGGIKQMVRQALSPAARPAQGMRVQGGRGRDGAALLPVPAGSFLRGVPKGRADEQPQRQITLSGFYIDAYEVSMAQYEKCVRAGSCRADARDSDCNYGKPGKQNHPMNCVSWYDAQSYCQWAGRRLPTEAEWERAARGTDGRMYPWGTGEPTCGLAQFRSCKNETVPVNAFTSARSPVGAVQMAGNVFEWVADYYGEKYYQVAPAQNPPGPEQGKQRVLRGGSFRDRPGYLRTTTRKRLAPDKRHYLNGFRCAASM